jgi:hypothetical protein
MADGALMVCMIWTAMLALVRLADPDVLALQEVDSRRTRNSEHRLRC